MAEQIRSLDEYIAARFGGLRTRVVRNPLVSQVGTTASEVAPNNPNRLALVVQNLSTNVVYVLDEGSVSATRGVRLAPSGGMVVIEPETDFQSVGYAWYAMASGAASDILVRSVEVR